jgi:hypothetical protein
MIKIIYNSFFLLFVIIISCVFSENNYRESFMPKIIKETYRPIERNIRTMYEGFYDKTSTNVSNLLRKIGIL